MLNLPEGMTAEKLRDIAAWLDTYDKLGEAYVRLTQALNIYIGDDNADAIEEILEIIRGKGIQDDLRRWADEIDGLL